MRRLLHPWALARSYRKADDGELSFDADILATSDRRLFEGLLSWHPCGAPWLPEMLLAFASCSTSVADLTGSFAEGT